MFSIGIPTYNNLDYLKLCISSIKKNSSFNHEILIHVNDGVDGTLDFVKKIISNSLTPKKILVYVLQLIKFLNWLQKNIYFTRMMTCIFYLSGINF